MVPSIHNRIDDGTQKEKEKLNAMGNEIKHVYREKKVDNDGAFATTVHCRSLFFLPLLAYV